MARKPTIYTLIFWIALFISELEIVSQHRRIDTPSGQHDLPQVPTHEYPSWYPHTSNHYAYAFLVDACDPAQPDAYRGRIFGVLVSVQMLESVGSKADIIVMIKMSPNSRSVNLPAEDLELFNAYPRVILRYLPTPPTKPQIEDKFRILQLTQYRRVLYLDSDVMPLCNLDYLFHLSEKGVLKDNVVLAGSHPESITKGFMMLRPGAGEYHHLINMLEPTKSTFSYLRGTYPPISISKHEVLYFWVKYVKKSASVFDGNKVEHWVASARNENPHPFVESTDADVSALKGNECPSSQNQQGEPGYSLSDQLWHFDDQQAIYWMVSDSKVLRSFQKSATGGPFLAWIQTLDQVKNRLNITSANDEASTTARALPSLAVNSPDVASEMSTVAASNKKYAYAYVLAGVDPAKRKGYRGILFGILVNVEAFQRAGSKADIVVLVQMGFEAESDELPEEDAAYLRAYPNVVIRYIPRPPEPHSFYSAQFDKFRILELTQYSRIIYFDADVTPLCNLDYLFEMSERGIFRENMLLAGNEEPSNGGFMMLRPRDGDYDQILKIIEARDAHILATSPNHTFDTTYGWGHVITPPDKWRTRYNTRKGTKWDFTTAYGNQGLMFYWTKYVKKDVSIFLGNEVDNWAPPSNLNETTPVLEATLIDAIKGHECPNRMEFVRDKYSKPPYDLEGQIVHFMGKDGKPWMVTDVSKALEGDDLRSRAYRVWFDHFEQVQKYLNISVAIQTELRGDPALGSWTLLAPMKKILQKKHAYAFLLADVDPEDPVKYKATMYGILVKIQLLEFFGATPDMVVMVQMAHNSESDKLPDKDAASLKAYPNVVIHYLPKAARAHTFYTLQLEKFRILDLTRYRRVLFFDTETLPLCKLDYLFYLSEKGTLKENIVVAGDDEPATRGFMMLRPGFGEYQQLTSVLDKRDDTIWESLSSNLTFDEEAGWGHTIQSPDRWTTRYNLKSGTLWNFSASFGDQGLLYHWVKYVKKSVSIFIGNEVENWSHGVSENESIPVLENTLTDIVKGYECSTRLLFPYDEHAKPPYDLEGQVWKFDGLDKSPWNLKDKKKVLEVDNKENRPYDMWFQLFEHVKRRLRNVPKTLEYNPELSPSNMSDDFKTSLERRHAYAFVLAGVAPEHPEGHSGILFSILVNAHTLESWGSKADIVVLVQMAHDSEWDTLPKEILKYLQAYPSIVIHYLPKPTEPPSFYSAQFDKFYILELTQYRRIIYFDADVMPMCNLDYLFHLSERGVFKENMLLAGNEEPSNGGFMMLRPRVGEYQQVRDIIDERDARILASPNWTFDKVLGWGHVIKPPDYWRTRYNRRRGTLWTFTTAFGNQGLMYYWAKYVKKSVSLFAGNEVENWRPPLNSSESAPEFEEKLVDAIRGHECPTATLFFKDNYRKGPYDLEGQMRHFGGKWGKPWMVRNITHILRSQDPRDLGIQLWFKTFQEVRLRLQIQVTLSQLRHDPKLGSWTTAHDFAASLERKQNITAAAVAQ